jgi:uncharacterized CHY-type Zn-finger protein
VDLDHIEENSEDLNIFVPLLNQLILKSNIANNVLYFCGICQKSLKSKQHMANHVEANHVVGVYHNCAKCGAKNKNHKFQKKDAPSTCLSTLILTMLRKLLTTTLARQSLSKSSELM